MATLREALQEFDKEPILLDDGDTLWRPDLLIDALEEGVREMEARRQPNEPEVTNVLDEEVYYCSDYIALLDEQGYQILPGMYSIVPIGEEPYRVEHDPKGYRVICVEDPKHDRWRYIYGQNLYDKKQGAYRRKSQLNEDWQKHRFLGA